MYVASGRFFSEVTSNTMLIIPNYHILQKSLDVFSKGKSYKISYGIIYIQIHIHIYLCGAYRYTCRHMFWSIHLPRKIPRTTQDRFEATASVFSLGHTFRSPGSPLKLSMLVPHPTQAC